MCTSLEFSSWPGQVGHRWNGVHHIPAYLARQVVTLRQFGRSSQQGDGCGSKTDRIIELRQRIRQLTEQYGSIEKLESQGNLVPADDHTLYTDLLEWRAIRHELEQLTHFLETV